MKYYLYYSPDFKTEYFVEKINKTTLSKIYEKLKEYIEPWFGCELLSFDDFSKSNKIIISYPIFNYNKVVVITSYSIHYTKLYESSFKISTVFLL